MNKLHRSRKHGNILTTIINREGHLQYEIVRQDCGASPAMDVGKDDDTEGASPTQFGYQNGHNGDSSFHKATALSDFAQYNDNLDQ